MLNKKTIPKCRKLL